ncbi:hypothetical protein Poly30_06630 [Planctomycetes bacterium Poly30]|uniref:FG-GAP repeat protein n=2 Tax=Saltatorellus ferox TaxID=2528018 RepID=A0A518EM46_9BACT|nr:hypothetical protein Poly30_06630 [Planctomycetes bacterium Poly30]
MTHRRPGAFIRVLGGICGAALLGTGSYLGASALRWTGYHAPPAPAGMSARYDLPAMGPMNTLRIGTASDEDEGEGDPMVLVDRHLGEVLRFQPSAPVNGASAAAFDLDGDGHEDDIVEGGTVVEVRSGSDGKVLFHDDDTHSRSYHRATALPDIDGDGGSELALVYPRELRWKWTLTRAIDLYVETKSWLVVVSHSAH